MDLPTQLRIDELGPVGAATRDHQIPAMKDGLTVMLTAGQILDLLLGSAPGALDTLEELAAALNDDANFAATVTAALAAKADAAATTAALADKADAAATTAALNGKQPLDAMLTAVAALTSGGGKFLAFSGADAPAVRDMVGTVSETAGIPTGAIVERGSNANGSYVRWADGTQICWHNITLLETTDITGAVYSGAAVTVWTFPVAFATVAPACSCCGSGSAGHWYLIDSIDTTTANALAWSYTARTGTLTARVSAIGRWF